MPSLIGSDLIVTGNINSKGEVQVEGEIKGDIHCGLLVVGDNALVTGGIVAEDVVVRGRVNGSINGVRVTLEASSQVEGDILHKTLAIEQGAFFEGKSRRSEDPIAAAAGSENKSENKVAASSSPQQIAATAPKTTAATGASLGALGNGAVSKSPTSAS